MTEKGGKVQKISSFSLCGAFFIPILQVSPNKSLYLQSQLLAESPNGWNAGIDTYIHKGVSCALVLTICELRNFKFLSKQSNGNAPKVYRTPSLALGISVCPVLMLVQHTRRGAFSVARFDRKGNAKAYISWNE